MQSVSIQKHGHNEGDDYQDASPYPPMKDIHGCHGVFAGEVVPPPPLIDGCINPRVEPCIQFYTDKHKGG